MSAVMPIDSPPGPLASETGALRDLLVPPPSSEEGGRNEEEKQAFWSGFSPLLSFPNENFGKFADELVEGGDLKTPYPSNRLARLPSSHSGRTPPACV